MAFVIWTHKLFIFAISFLSKLNDFDIYLHVSPIFSPTMFYIWSQNSCFITSQPFFFSFIVKFNEVSTFQSITYKISCVNTLLPLTIYICTFLEDKLSTLLYLQEIFKKQLKTCVNIYLGNITRIYSTLAVVLNKQNTYCKHSTRIK